MSVKYILFRRGSSKDIEDYSVVEDEFIYLIDKEEWVIGTGNGEYKSFLQGREAYKLSGIVRSDDNRMLAKGEEETKRLWATERNQRNKENRVFS